MGQGTRCGLNNLRVKVIEIVEQPRLVGRKDFKDRLSFGVKVHCVCGKTNVELSSTDFIQNCTERNTLQIN